MSARRPSLCLHAPRAARDGFALLIALTLLAFLVLLLIGLATYARLESAVSGNAQRQELARENALLALDVALGQLQKFAGPDRRATATAEIVPGASAGKTYYTGVWDGATNDKAPLAWLVSGMEAGAVEDVTTPVPADAAIELVGEKSSGIANSVVATLQDVRTVGVPGVPSGTAVTIGRYAWWVGDQGVKAPVAVPDDSGRITYTPYDSTELRRRIRQQMGFGAEAVEAGGEPLFDPHDANNSPLVAGEKIAAYAQLAFLKDATGTAIGPARVQQNFHAWSPDNFAVLANARAGGLRQDLSLQPDLLGPAFAAWADYRGYMENPVSPMSPAPSPPFSTDPLRRRYVMRPAMATEGASTSVAPVLSYFLLTFNVRTRGGSAAVRSLEARARWMFSLWNPYSAALVPENLRLEIAGLPTLTVTNETRGSVAATVSLGEVYGSPMNISLPWEAATIGNDDRQSWLAGRVYTWTALENTSNAGAPAGGFASRFYSRNLSADAGQGVQQVASPNTVDGDDFNRIQAGPGRLIVTLSAARAGGDVKLATFTSPPFEGFSTTPQKFSAGTYQFSFVFRLAESFDTPAMPESWLATPGRDCREPVLPAEAFVAVPNGPRPELYPNFTAIAAPDRLLDRAANALSYDEDAPVFELPRAPVLSVGELQHVALTGKRPFAIGNSWGSDARLNGLGAAELFDRFFFSGLADSVVPAAESRAPQTPSPLLRVLRDRKMGNRVTAADLRAVSDGFSSKHLLQRAAFNVNSTSAPAWTAVLRAVRFSAANPFAYLDADFGTGTSGDESVARDVSGGARFARFAQSAQETFKSDPGYAASRVAPPNAPDVASAANTHLFRRGLRELTAPETAALGEHIARRVAEFRGTHGAIRSLEAFLSPSMAGGSSLLEQAIADAAINAAVPEFSSQWLTQADMLTALAPVLFSRSDTFLIRAYGEATNPVTGATDARAWCEATVQREPDYFDSAADDAVVPPAALTGELNKRYGRRFRIVSFRWLTRFDI